MRHSKEALDSFAEACRSRGLSVTHQRLAVYEAVVRSHEHPGAEEIFRAVRARVPTISRGTVYREWGDWVAGLCLGLVIVLVPLGWYRPLRHGP